jgi:hypothetical protein
LLKPNTGFWQIIPSIEYKEHRNQLGNRERGGGKEIAQNGKSPQLLGHVAGQPKLECYTEGISHPNQADDSHMIHFGHGRDHQIILVTLAT